MSPGPLGLILFCRVVDNFGDIAVVWRLIKGLLQRPDHLTITLVTDHLEAFSQLVPQVLAQGRQFLGNVEVWEWSAFEEAFEKGSEEPLSLPPVAVEAFACEMPPGFLKAFYHTPPASPELLSHRIVINLEYLTAESWFTGVHLMPALNPSPFVQKFTFVPGFLPQLGGLILDQEFLDLVHFADTSPSEAREEFWRDVKSLTSLTGSCPRETFWISIFSYEHNFTNLFQALLLGRRPTTLFVPQGRMTPGFTEAYTAFEAQGLSSWVQMIPLPFLPQNIYDRMVTVCDFNLVRGEESLVRACLSEKPFLWHAYLQDEGYQMVKVKALLEVMAPLWSRKPLQEQVETQFLAYNQRERNSEKDLPQERFEVFLDFAPEIRLSLKKFAKFLKNNGDSAQKLLDFLYRFRV